MNVIPKSPTWAEIESESRPDTVYSVHVEGDKVTCTCPHFTYRLRGTEQQCKHIKAAVAYYKKNRGKLCWKKES